MARKTNPAAACGCILMIIGFIVLLLIDWLIGLVVFGLGLVFGLIGVLAGLFSDLFGIGDAERPSQIIVVDQKHKDKESETDDDGYNPDLPAYLREPKKKSPKAKRPQPRKKTTEDREDTDKK